MVQKPRAALGDVRADLPSVGVPEVPQLAFEVDERHRRPPPGQRGAGHRRAEVVDQSAEHAPGLLVASRAATGRRELAKQPQQEQRLVLHPDPAIARLPQPGQPRQQFSTVIQIRPGMRSWCSGFGRFFFFFFFFSAFGRSRMLMISKPKVRSDLCGACAHAAAEVVGTERAPGRVPVGDAENGLGVVPFTVEDQQVCGGGAER